MVCPVGCVGLNLKTIFEKARIFFKKKKEKTQASGSSVREITQANSIHNFAFGSDDFPKQFKNSSKTSMIQKKY